jgi:hypothetical protein
LSTGFILRALLPVMLIGLGIYVLRGYIFKKKEVSNWSDSPASTNFALSRTSYPSADYNVSDFAERSRSGSWKDI